MQTAITTIAVVLIAVVQLMDVLNMSRATKQIEKLEEEHDHLADKCGKAIMQVEKDLIKQRIENIETMKHVENIIKAADEVIKASDDLNNTYREFIELTKSQEEEADDEERSQ